MRKGTIGSERQIARAQANHTYERLAWAAARALLVRVTRDSFYGHLDPVMKADIERFLTRHPRKEP